jgi:hypothetical protein
LQTTPQLRNIPQEIGEYSRVEYQEPGKYLAGGPIILVGPAADGRTNQFKGCMKWQKVDKTTSLAKEQTAQPSVFLCRCGDLFLSL